jgi:hypothetical protein
MQLRRQEGKRSGRGITDEERLARGLADDDVGSRFYRRVLVDATGRAGADQDQRDKR